MACWILSWDDTGLEALVNLTELHEKFVFEVLAETTKINPIFSVIDRLTLRARYNSQRNYEIYSVNTELDENEIKDHFEHNAEVFKNLVRKHANKKLFP